ncbi:MAG: hypothetical protein KA020_15090 [Planctomycetes bacterium]|nr:hypothetical protein [Planctomycetota bacterium]
MRIAAALVCTFLATTAIAQEPEKKFEITPAVQAQLDVWKKTVAEWAADPKVVAAVEEQNKKGPLEGMDNKKWKALRRRSPEVEAYQTNVAAKQLAEKSKASNGIVSEAFLNAQKGEKVAFLEKTSSYLHAGSPKFDQPFQKLQTWQGKPEFDESSQAYAVQVSVPVLDPKNPKQAIGVLVVGINLTQVASPKPPAPAPAPAK